VSDDEAAARGCDDAQDAELVRVAAYAGLRRGELVALRWRDVHFAGQKLIVRRALSGATEVRSTKSCRAREVPLPNQAAAALEPLRFHDLRHTYGSLLVAGGIDLSSVKAAMGHARITTTGRYLHARPASELADRFTLALGGSRAAVAA
jgi:integrase